MVNEPGALAVLEQKVCPKGTIEKRGLGQWRAKVRKRGHPDQTKSFSTKAKADRWAKKIETEIEDGQFLSRREAEKVTVEMLLNRYKEEITPFKKSAAVENYRIDACDNY